MGSGMKPANACRLKAKTDAASFSQAAVARVYAALGDKDEAFKVLFRLVEAGNWLSRSRPTLRSKACILTALE